jgi:hypothetical protein
VPEVGFEPLPTILVTGDHTTNEIKIIDNLLSCDEFIDSVILEMIIASSIHFVECDDSTEKNFRKLFPVVF